MTPVLSQLQARARRKNQNAPQRCARHGSHMASDQRAAGAANLSALPVCLPKVYPPAAISSMQRRMGARCIAHGSKLIAFDDVRRAEPLPERALPRHRCQFPANWWLALRALLCAPTTNPCLHLV